MIIVPISVAVGSVIALFLWLLDLATETRVGHPWLLYLGAEERRLMLTAGIAAGFGACFGTPLAGEKRPQSFRGMAEEAVEMKGDRS